MQQMTAQCCVMVASRRCCPLSSMSRNCPDQCGPHAQGSRLLNCPMLQQSHVARSESLTAAGWRDSMRAIGYA